MKHHSEDRVPKSEYDDEEDPTQKSRKGKKGSSSGGGFESLGLSEAVYRGVKKMGFRVPTPVQRKSLPICLSGKDAVVMARTGSGKTAAFVLTVLERLLWRLQNASNGGSSSANSSIRALILSPTRELALQTLKVTQTLACFTPLKAVGIVGGDSIESQFSVLASRPHIVVATPGRLSHLLREIPDLTLTSCDTLVLDEADRLLEMGFSLQVREICAAMPSPESRQTMLFSATMPKTLIEFTRSGTILSDDPAVVRLEKDVNVSDELRVGFITCRSDEKDAALLHLVRDVCDTLPSRNTGSKKSTSETNDDEEEEEEEDTTASTGTKKRRKGEAPSGLILIFAATRHHVEYLTTFLRLHSINATQIYGTMDHDARQVALASFRRGITPVLVVTDVAARGIDVPLIDVVIHHSFPPSAKLFVHRSGRAARAGRLGWAFALVDPEEMPYMADLHVFLGRKLTAANDVEPYSLLEMTADMVHYGSIPEAILTQEMESIQRLLAKEISGGHAHDVETVQNLYKVCQNSMKQFRKSRPDASREGVRRAKQILHNGGFVNVPPHPVLAHWERQHHEQNFADGATSKETQDKYWEERKKREEFLHAMSKFRPKETIFESQAAARAANSIKSSQVDKNKKVDSLSAKTRLDSGLTAMKNMRRQMRLIRSKGESMVVAGSVSALALNGEGIDMATSSDKNPAGELGLAEELHAKPLALIDALKAGPPEVVQSKKRISKAERKRSKSGQPVETYAAVDEAHPAKRIKTKSGRDFRDEEHFIDVESGFDERSRKIEASMQPSASDGRDLRSTALRLEESMLNILGDEKSDLVKHHRIMRWDKSKRKYVQTTLGAETSGDSKSKRIRLESGQLVKQDRAKLGQLYEKWQKKTSKSIGRTSVFDDVVDEEDRQANVRLVRGIEVGKGNKEKNKNPKDQPTKKSAAQIRKEREAKMNMKMKNMKKEDRKRIEGKMRAKGADKAKKLDNKRLGKRR